jgi:histidine--tRNA ligase
MIIAPKGTKDVTPSEAFKWHFVEDTIKERADIYGYREIRTPTFEYTELFQRGVGDTTDVVQKEMYTFTDKGGRSLTLKPEGTAGAVRSFVEHGLYNSALPLKAYYFIPVFRYERPQAGRYREHHQFGAEVFGATEPTMDAELIAFALDIISSFGINELSLCINSIGCPKCRAEYNAALKEYMNSRREELCSTCRERLDKNPLRILDCKVPSCGEIAANAPVILDYLCDDCREHFEKLKQLLDAAGIAYTVDPHIVRGLDYYVRTVFEIIYTQPGGDKITVCGGGRYDGLSAQISDVSVASAGFGMGLERLIMVLENAGILPPDDDNCRVFIASMGQRAETEAFTLAQRLRALGIRAEINHCKRSLKAQMKYADKIRAQSVIVIGDNEVDGDVYTVKDMASGEESVFAKADIASAFA